MANEFLQNRVVQASFTLPAMAAGSTASTLSMALDPSLYIPAGAIVTRVGYVLGAQTEIASMKDATMQISVSNINLHSNNVKASVALSVGVACTGTLGKADGVYIGTGGVPVMHLASSDNARSGISANGTMHIGYIAGIIS
jgi:hypothetical protein